jgi:hypothetical protein
MSQIFVFEELDDATREYLLAVRGSQGEGAPGVFIPTSSRLAGCGCVLGPLVIILTLVLTLTTAINVVYDDPVKVAFLQTAGFLVGGWLLFAAFRTWGSKQSQKTAGFWVYADPLHLYEANREQVKVTRIDDVVEANFTHNYNNGAYQNTVIRVLLGEGRVAAATVKNEARAEQMVVFLNYLAWARGPDGGERAALAPAVLGGLAAYVARHDVEPKDAEGGINLNLVELDVTEVPEEPTRAGRAAPNVLPYLAMLAAAAGVFFLMAYVVNPPIRDDALAAAVTRPPTEPVFLRAYLIDPRNKNHRADIQNKLNAFYEQAAAQVRNAGQDDDLKEGLAQLLLSLKIPDDPLVSVKVTERNARDGAEGRVKKLRDDLVGTVQGQKQNANAANPEWFTATGGILGKLSQLMPQVQPPAGVVFPKPRTPVGLQLVQFAEVPEGADHAHIEVGYEFVPRDPKNPRAYYLRATVEFRTDVTADPVKRYASDAGEAWTPDQFEKAVDDLRTRLLLGMIGTPQ